MNKIHEALPGAPQGGRVGATLGRWVMDDTWLKRLLTAQRWMSRAYFELRYLRPDPWHLTTSAYERERVQASIGILGDRRYARALEVGCGEGMTTARLVDRCDRIVAVDLSHLALGRARRRVAGTAQVELRPLDVRIGEPPGTYDLVFCAELFYYFNRGEFEDVASRMVRWVAPGGDLCLVHGTSIHDATRRAGGGGSGEMGAGVIHDWFCRRPGLAVLRDRFLPRYRVTLLRRREGHDG